MNEQWSAEPNSTSTTVASSTISSIPQREQVLIDTFNTYIQIGIGGLLFLFGLTFNCLSLLYFRVSRSFRHTTFQLYFSIISILDTIRLLEFLVFILFDKGYLKVTLILCRAIFFTIMFTGQASIWLTVALAVEKCVIIWFPIKGRLCFTMFISKMVLSFVLLLVFLADVIYLLPRFFLNTYVNISIHTFMCVWQTDSQSSLNTYDQWKKHYFTFNTVFFHSIIPSILLLMLNWLILYSLSKHRDDLSKLGSIDAKNTLKREKQFKEKTIQLVFSSFFVIITISPRYILTMVNAFATSISKVPIMPLYIYVNLNTVFRVLEMGNYSLNMIIVIMSGRTSRQEIRKLLWECLFWRFKRTPSDRQELKYPTQAFLFDDEDDTDRASPRPGSSPYCALTVHSTARQNFLTPQSSSGAASFQTQRTTTSSAFNCCGFTIDLSHKDRYLPYSRSTFDESSTYRSTISKTATNPNLLPCRTTPNQLSITRSLSPGGAIRQQKTICYRSNLTHRPITRRRAATLVHCSNKSPSSAPRTSLMTKPLVFATSVETADPPCQEKLSIEHIPGDEVLPPAYIIERC